MKTSACIGVLVCAAAFLGPQERPAALWAAPPGPAATVTYPGDTKESISRRAKWIEGAKKEGSMIWWGALRPPEAREIINAFNQAYPFISVDYWRGRGEEIATKLEAGFTSDRINVDTALGGTPENYPRWRKMGALVKFVHLLPGADKLDPKYHSRHGDWILPAIAPKIPQFNTRLISAAEVPKSWEGLLDAKWKGHLGAEVESMDWAVLALADGGWGVERTEAYLTKLKAQNPRMIHGGSAAHSLLIAGEFKIMAMGNLRHVLISQQKHAPVDWVRSVDPIPVLGPSLTIQAKSPHPNAAHLFLEWSYTPKGRLAWAEVTQNYVPGIDTPIAGYLESKNLIVRTEDVLLDIIKLDLINKWNRIIFGMTN